ncbi:DivIVA domain-containing protein [Paeniglutamicibacter sp. MACA_103]|uniref:DivIVA domain-containing protein n=1 Tax=Paeniglutamicibacter sp. MACA_103 TaxID=3377337 RepID=UPI003896625C
MLLVVAIVILGAAVCLGVGSKRSRAGREGQRFEPIRGPIHGLVEPVATLPPVLLPERPSAEDVENVSFSLALRGYRCDQVDEVLGALSAEISRLHEVIAAHGKDPVISNTSHSSE